MGEVHVRVYGAADALGGYEAWLKHAALLEQKGKSFQALVLVDWDGQADQFSLVAGRRTGVVCPNGWIIQLAGNWQEAIFAWAKQ